MTSIVVETAIGVDFFVDGLNGGLGFPGCFTGLLIDGAEFPFTFARNLDVFFARESPVDVWFTGKQLHSFLKRIQLMQRPCASEDDVMHLIFRRRQ
jgi:hypothetical protein